MSMVQVLLLVILLNTPLDFLILIQNGQSSVTLANKQSCVSIVKNFNYTANILYKIPTLECNEIARRYGTIKIEKAYHSYTGVPDIFGGCVKTIQCGNRDRIFRVDNSLYLATFIIPSGYVYFTNEEGEIVSNKIMYTGRYLKL